LEKPLESYTIDGESWVYELDPRYLYKVAIRGTRRQTLFETTAIDEVQDVTI
jgi:hypothetical protein